MHIQAILLLQVVAVAVHLIQAQPLAIQVFLEVAEVAALLRIVQFPQAHQVLEHQDKEMQAEFQQAQTVNRMLAVEGEVLEPLGCQVLVRTAPLEMAAPALHQLFLEQ